jgi:hypothetical protein
METPTSMKTALACMASVLLLLLVVMMVVVVPL